MKTMKQIKHENIEELMWHIFYYFDFFHLNKWVYSHWLVSRHDTGILCTYLTLVFLSSESNAKQELETRFTNIVLRSETCYSLSKLQYMPGLLSSYGHTVFVFLVSSFVRQDLAMWPKFIIILDYPLQYWKYRQVPWSLYFTLAF